MDKLINRLSHELTKRHPHTINISILGLPLQSNACLWQLQDTPVVDRADKGQDWQPVDHQLAVLQYQWLQHGKMKQFMLHYVKINTRDWQDKSMWTDSIWINDATIAGGKLDIVFHNY